MVDLYKDIPVLSKDELSTYIYSNNNHFLKILSKFPYLKNYILKSRPITIMIETTNICTNDCIICPKSSISEKKTIMSMNLFKKVLSDYSKMGGGYISLTPQIGDIFTDNLIKKRIDLIKDFPKIKGSSVTTNAVNITSISNEELKNILNSFLRIHISIYGLDEEEYFLMTRRNTYNKVVNNIRRILDISDTNNIIFGFRLLKNHTESEINDWIIKNFQRKIPFGYTSTFHNWGGKTDTASSM